MKHSEYSVKASSSLLTFEFNSEGPKGTIRKQVVFAPIAEDSNIYNLGLGDIDDSGEVNDSVISNNNDTQRVLKTVASTIFRFFEIHPEYHILIMGGTPARTRLYRMGICNNIENVKDDFEIFGLTTENEWRPFEPNRHYEAFLITNKNQYF